MWTAVSTIIKLELLHVIAKILIQTIKRNKLAAKTVDEDPASCKRWISRKEIKSVIKKNQEQDDVNLKKAGMASRIIVKQYTLF